MNGSDARIDAVNALQRLESIATREELSTTFIVGYGGMSERRDKWDRTRLTLIGRLKDRGDHRSWDEFVDIYWRRVYSVAMSRGLNDAEAKDATQETIIGVMQDIEGYDPKLGRFTTWLLGRSRWRIEDQLRKRKHQGNYLRPEADTRTDPLHCIPDDAAAQKRGKLEEEEWREYLFKVAVEHIKNDVNAQHFQVFDLLVRKKLSVEKVAALTGIVRATLDTIKHRVLLLLKREIETLKRVSP